MSPTFPLALLPRSEFLAPAITLANYLATTDEVLATYHLPWVELEMPLEIDEISEPMRFSGGLHRLTPKN